MGIANLGIGGNNQFRLTGITSAAPGAFYNIPLYAQIKIIPTAAGTATLYSTGSQRALVDADVTAGNAAIVANTNAQWDIWGAGAVTVRTTQQAQMPLSSIALVVTSGTWTLEVCY